MSELEARYRRLLEWYPRAHRAVHEEEMLGVLMASAEPGRARPRLADSADLIRGAILIRLRTAFGAESGPSWRRAFGLAGLVAALVLTGEQIGNAINAWIYGFDRWSGAIASAVALASVLIVVLIRYAPRWPAVAATWAWSGGLIAWNLSMLLPLDFSGTYSFSSSQLLPVVLMLTPYALTALLVTFRVERPAMPYRRMLGWTALFAAAVVPQNLSLGLLGYEWDTVLLMPPLTVVAVAAGCAARSASGRRTILLAAAPVGLLAGFDLIVLVMTGSWLFGWLGLLIPAVVMLVVARRGSRVPRAGVPEAGRG
ncbi:hypothetical protein Aph01nite_40390 [Acrocarpospora phusangensis]|uniref:Uncharacterized protein n=1 Tax=Acrocarpospora phusangensis TaxID=1070424 RepID=A0A919UL83_9ACTN|nr:hypothetical protein [Acrocarpospora phusangensis]GIH25729.1 hypothetical protein Aph01nite_40390 [Acrocarpospora phusangensis]